MRVIITGGTGMIGSRLANDLAAEGHEVIVLSRSPALATGLSPRVRVEGWDAKTSRGWGPLADGADAIVNLAGASIAGDGFLPSRWTEERKRLIVDSRVNAGKAIVAAIEEAERKPAVVIQSSAIGYYGNHPNRVEITEDSPPGDDWLAQGVCIPWETSTEAVEGLGVRRVIVRSGLVLDFEEGVLPRLALPYQMFVGGPMGSGKQPYSWIHRADEIGALRFLLRHPQASGAFNLTAPNPVTNAEFGRALGHVLNRPSLIPVPGFAMNAVFGEVAATALEGQRVLPRHLLELGYEFQFTDVEAALRDLHQQAEPTQV
ncbi:MAG: TIGR01777 family oxidoreductase [Anaerolineae bacterium]|nr:TIGR01777 family oxidoreductase [Anaerolineae bacterium]